MHIHSGRCDSFTGGPLWVRTEAVFLGALRLPPGERAAYLDQACAGDAVLRAEAESLLAYDGDPSSLSDAFKASASAIVEYDALAGQRVGAYRITGELGRGGMGAVYRAVRDDDEFRKDVAIKVVKRGMDTDAMLGRFRHERQILANLDHPCIARLLDGGSAGGQPFFVMELVEGVPIDEHCRASGLDTGAICALFLRVCEGVEYAHHNLVIHRDLKPSNILVSADGSPKLLDFGVAKLLHAAPEASATVTSIAMRPMTPEYASPEQYRGGAVSTATDVYALAAVLYELLTGARAHRLREAGPEHWERIICEEPVPAPRLQNRRIPRDLETVVMKGLQKLPERRYPSVEQFAADVRRYLEGRPVEARPDTLFYRAAKFTRRNWLGVSAAAALLAALGGGILTTAWQAQRANRAQEAARAESERAKIERDHAVQAGLAAGAERNRALAAEHASEQARAQAIAERQRADTEAASAKAVVDFLSNDVLAQANPGNATKDHTVRAALDRAAARLDGKFPAQPLVEATIRGTIAESYFSLGHFAEAEAQYLRAFELRSQHAGPRDRSTLDSMVSLAATRRVLGKLDQAEALYKQALDIQLATLGERHPATLLLLSNLAVVYRHQGKFAEAEALNLRVLAVQRATLGVENLDTLQTMNNLGVVYTRERKFGEAEALYREVLAVRTKVQGPDHPTTAFTKSNLAVTLAASNPEEAARLFREALDVQQRKLGEDHASTLYTSNNLGLLELARDNYAEAGRIFAKVAAARSRVLGPLHAESLFSASLLGETLVRQGHFQEAEAALRDVLANYEHSGDKSPRYFVSMALLGQSLAGQQRRPEAEKALLTAYDALSKQPPDLSATVTLSEVAQWLASVQTKRDLR